MTTTNNIDIADDIESRLAASVHELVDMQFNPTMDVTNILMKTMENMMSNFAQKCVEECAKKYGFDYEEAIEFLGLMKVSIKTKAIKRGTKEPKVAKAPKVPCVRVSRAKFSLPFIPELVNQSGCFGLALNGGLFTQCPKSRAEGSNYCAKCREHESSNPEYSTYNIQGRLACGLMDFTDQKGRKPISYLSYLSKKEVSRTEAEEKAKELGVVIPSIYFEPLAEKKGRGRPKKTKQEVVAENGEDLFNQMQETEEKPKKGKAKVSEEEKEERKSQREAKKRALLEQKENERVAELEQKANVEVKVPEPEPPAQAQAPVPQEDEPTKKRVKVFKVDGKKYLRDDENVAYDFETKEPIGTYDPTTKGFIPSPKDDDDDEVDSEEEEEEEEYDA